MFSSAECADREECPGAVRRRRDAHVARIIGDVERAYVELQQGYFRRFVDAYLCFLSYY